MTYIRACLRWLARGALVLLMLISLVALLAWPTSYRWAWCNMIRGEDWSLSVDVYCGGVSGCWVTGAVRSAHDDRWASSLEEIDETRNGWDLPGTWAGFDF